MGSLIEESQDLHHDAMAATVPALDEMVETGREARAARTDRPGRVPGGGRPSLAR